MVRFYLRISCFFILCFGNICQAQSIEFYPTKLYCLNGDGFEERVELNPQEMEHIYWVIETNNDIQHNSYLSNERHLERFYEELELVLSCKRLKILQIEITDDAIHYPEELLRIRELDSLKCLYVFFGKRIVINSINQEVLLTDEIEEFAYRPLDLSFLRGMEQLTFFGTNWNGEVHDPDALLSLRNLKFAQVPVASLQPDFFALTNLIYVQCGEQLKLPWHKNDQKLKPWFDGIKFQELLLSNTQKLYQMEFEFNHRKKPIDWKNAFLQIDHEGDTLFHLRGTGKNYTIDFLKSPEDYEYSSAYRLKRTGDEISVNVVHERECLRTSSVEIVGGDTLMSLQYFRRFTLHEEDYCIQINDHFVNSKRTGNYDLLENGALYTRRTYERDSIIFHFPNSYGSVFNPIYELLSEYKANIGMFASSAILENDEIVRIDWASSYKKTAKANRVSMEVEDTLLDGTTIATDVSGDTILLMNFKNGIKNGNCFRKYTSDDGIVGSETIFYTNGYEMLGTRDDGKYITKFNNNEGAKNILSVWSKKSGILIKETLYHKETGEYEYLNFDKVTGELIQSKRVSKDLQRIRKE